MNWGRYFICIFALLSNLASSVRSINCEHSGSTPECRGQRWINRRASFRGRAPAASTSKLRRKSGNMAAVSNGANLRPAATWDAKWPIVFPKFKYSDCRQTKKYESDLSVADCAHYSAKEVTGWPNWIWNCGSYCEGTTMRDANENVLNLLQCTEKRSLYAKEMARMKFEFKNRNGKPQKREAELTQFRSHQYPYKRSMMSRYIYSGANPTAWAHLCNWAEPEVR